MSIFSTAFLAAAVVIGQAAGPANPHLQQLSPLVGSWTGNIDLPGLPDQNVKVTYQWTLEGKFLEARWQTLDGTDLGPEFFAWDPIHQTIKLWGFDPLSFYVATWHIDGNVWTGKYTGTQHGGDPTDSTIILEFGDDGTLTLKGLAPDSDKTNVFGKLTRVTPTGPGSSLLAAFMEDFGGEWVTEMTAEVGLGPLKQGDKFNAYHAYTWSPDREAAFLTFCGHKDGQVFDNTKGIVGWDPSRKAVVLRWYDSLGATAEMVVRKKEGAIWYFDWDGSDAEGGKYTWTGTITLDAEKRHVRETKRIVKGEARPDRAFTWTRKPQP